MLIYAALVWCSGSALGVSNNYFVILPLLASAFAFKLPGGIAAGALALPANLALFALMGHPEFSPASKIMAEMAGLIFGLAVGFLADYFGKVEAEIESRIATEESLRAVLAEKEILLREIHHRVRNNLNIIKSLVQLQKSRSSNPEFIEAADELIGRIFAIALGARTALWPGGTPRRRHPILSLGPHRQYFERILRESEGGGHRGRIRDQGGEDRRRSRHAPWPHRQRGHVGRPSGMTSKTWGSPSSASLSRPRARASFSESRIMAGPRPEMARRPKSSASS